VSATKPAPTIEIFDITYALKKTRISQTAKEQA